MQSITSTTNQVGQATTNVTVGPLAAGSTATLNACQAPLNVLCAQFTVSGVPVELATLTAISGAGQTLAAGAVPSPVSLAVADNVGHPLAGATVNFYEVLSAWQPPCTVEGRCPAAQTLAIQTVTATSDANGLVTLIPLTGAGQPTVLLVNATTGQQSSLRFTIEQHP